MKVEIPREAKSDGIVSFGPDGRRRVAFGSAEANVVDRKGSSFLAPSTTRSCCRAGMSAAEPKPLLIFR